MIKVVQENLKGSPLPISRPFTFLGIFYVAIPYALLNIAAFENGEYNFEIIFGCLLHPVGKRYGVLILQVPLFGRESFLKGSLQKNPGKGALGGAILAFAFAFLIDISSTPCSCG